MNAIEIATRIAQTKTTPYEALAAWEVVAEVERPAAWGITIDAVFAKRSMDAAEEARKSAPWPTRLYAALDGAYADAHATDIDLMLDTYQKAADARYWAWVDLRTALTEAAAAS